ncbi:hypothetical protein OBV_20440 [Oscillibacter valericigenes Sjm18-20]|nr:hypothetical protein OBV_20440 [Oscillibacter valericigenes Sjm18-20]
MPDLDGKKSDSYQFLEQMSTEKLKSIARADFESGDSDDAANDEFITRVMEVIAQRDEEDPTAPHFDVEAGWKDFQENYCPTEEKTIDVYGDNKQNKLVHESSKNEEQADLKAPQPKRAGHRFLRIITIAAAVVCLCAVAANAFEINIFKYVCTMDAGFFPIPYRRSFIAGSGVYLRHRAGYKPDVRRRIEEGGHHAARFAKVGSGRIYLCNNERLS